MFTFNPFKTQSFAIDLGNNNTLLTDQERILLSQPSYIVFDKVNQSVKAVGDEAYDIFEKNHHGLKPVKPMRWGVIADYESASAMMHEMVSQTFTLAKRIAGFDNIISGVPYSTTEVERRALRDSLEQFNARRTQLVFEPLAAAMGMGLNIREPDGKMIVDIGGGITEIVIISLSGVAVFHSSKVAGDTFNEDIQDYFRREQGILIGLKTAERIKILVGSVLSNLVNPPAPVTLTGKGLQEGIPVTRKTTSDEMARVLEKSFRSIEENIIQTLEICPPELAADIYSNGIYLTGGGAMLRGIKERLQATTGLAVHIDQHPLLSVTKGISTTLRDPNRFKSILL